MLYLITRLRLAFWFERKRPTANTLASMQRRNETPEWLYSPKDDRFSADTKFTAFQDFLNRVLDSKYRI